MEEENKHDGFQETVQEVAETVKDTARDFTQEVMATATSTAEPVTVKQWLLFWLCGLINIIPFVGTIAYLILICVIAFKEDLKVPPSLKTFCKAYLVLLGVVIVLGVVFVGSFMGMIFGMCSRF